MPDDARRQAVLLGMAARDDPRKPDDVCLNRLWYNLLVGDAAAVAGDSKLWGRHMSERCRAQLRAYFGWLRS